MVTISSEPMFTGPEKSERISLSVPSTHIVDIEQRPRLLAVAPDLDVAAGWRAGDLAAQRCGRLLLATGPGAFRAEDVVVADNPHGDAVIALIGEMQPLAEQLLPAILAVWRRQRGAVLGAVRPIRVVLVVRRIHARQ
jgi:hypothetical protein